MNKDKEDALEAARMQIGHLGALIDDIVKQSSPGGHTPSYRRFIRAQAELHEAKLIRELGQAEASLEVVRSMLAHWSAIANGRLQSSQQP